MRNTHWRSSAKNRSRCLKQFRIIHGKTSELKFLFNKFAGLMVLSKRNSRAEVFLFSENFKTTYLEEHIQTDA